MDSEKFNKIREHSKKALEIGKEISLDELARKFESYPGLVLRYSEQVFAIGRELAELLQKKEVMKGELWLDLKSNPNRSKHPRYSFHLKTKEDFENQYQSYPEYRELSDITLVVENQYREMQGIVDAAKQFGYSLKNLLDLKKLQAGVLN